MFSTLLNFKGSRPEWCISSMIYSRDIPFWSETLDFVLIYWTFCQNLKAKVLAFSFPLDENQSCSNSRPRLFCVLRDKENLLAIMRMTNKNTYIVLIKLYSLVVIRVLQTMFERKQFIHISNQPKDSLKTSKFLDAVSRPYNRQNENDLQIKLFQQRSKLSTWESWYRMDQTGFAFCWSWTKKELQGAWKLCNLKGSPNFVLLLVAKRPSNIQGQICSSSFTCCPTEIEVADQTFHLTQSQYTDTRPTSPRSYNTRRLAG